MITDGCNNSTKGYAGAKPPLRSGGNNNEDEGNMGLGAETRADSDEHDGHRPAMTTLVCWGAQTRADRDTYQGAWVWAPQTRASREHLGTVVGR